MAKKQQIGPSTSIVGASAELFESRSAMPLLESATEEFGKAIKMVEEEQQRIQDRVNEYMGDLKTDIDFTTLEPGMEKEVRRYLLEGKNEYSTLANELARLSDASDPRYQEITDRMNEIQQGYSNLAAELGAYNQNKITTAESIRLEEYSKGTDQLGRVSGVYGLDGTKPNMSIKDGHMVFNVNGEEVEYYKMKGLPGVATEAAGFILDTQIAVGKSGVEMTSFERNRYSRVIDDKLRNQDVLGSILSDYPDELPLEDLREKFFDLRANGKLDAAALKEIRTEVKERILKSYDEANAVGVREARRKAAATAGKRGGSDMSSSMQEKLSMWTTAVNAYNKGVPFQIKNLDGTVVKYDTPHRNPRTGAMVWTKQVWVEELGKFIDVKNSLGMKGTKEWTLDEIQADFGYSF